MSPEGTYPATEEAKAVTIQIHQVKFMNITLKLPSSTLTIMETMTNVICLELKCIISELNELVKLC